MKNLEYKFIKLPGIARKDVFFSTISKINDIRIKELESTFNELAEDGWLLVEIYWFEGLALFKKDFS